MQGDFREPFVDHSRFQSKIKNKWQNRVKAKRTDKPRFRRTVRLEIEFGDIHLSFIMIFSLLALAVTDRWDSVTEG